MKLRKNKTLGIILSGIIAIMASFLPLLSVNAATIYISDGNYYDEGYIFIGESHMQLAAFAVMFDKIEELEGVQYAIYADSSVVADAYGDPGTFTMTGNLFFVFEGMGRDDELQKQISKEYIYSDGAGQQGGAVQKIHTIMDTNPNIAHWNIISFHGANAALTGKKDIADYYVASYRNWIDYEFPDADCYFLPQSTMTKNFTIFCKDKEVFNRTLAEAFPDEYLDIMPFFWEHYPHGLLDPRQKSDLVHWSGDTYYEMISGIILYIQEKRNADVPLYTITETQTVLYTNSATVIYEKPNAISKILFSKAETGLPILVTGVTDNRYFRVSVGDIVGYVFASGLSADAEVNN